MWLTKDEKETLVFYYRKWANESSSFPFKEPFDERVHICLRDRDLIIFDIGGARVSLTHEGIRLGQIYNSWWSRSNLWYTEYIKHHWICVIYGFLFGIISGLLIKWLSSKIFG
jgi:hypothetical protein